MKQDKVQIATRAALMSSLIAAIVLLAPGVWWGDSLNAYIQGVTGIFGTAQPPLFALLCSVSRMLYPGPLPIFLFCVTLYYAGLAIFTFRSISSLKISIPLFFLLGFWPVLFANIGVIQTEALQLALLSILIAMVYVMNNYTGRLRMAILVASVAALLMFSLIRYDSLFITIILGYWVGYTFFRMNKRKAVYASLAIVAVFFLLKNSIDGVLGFESGQKSEMSTSLLVADIAAISAESGINYIPDYCWQEYLPQEERNIKKVEYGLIHWKQSFYSYIYNIDPSIGLFRYAITDRNPETMAVWIKVLTKHPLLYLKFHFMSFWYFLTNDNFNMGIWSGLKDSHDTQVKLMIERNAAVDSFLNKYPARYAYTHDRIILTDDKNPMTAEEEAQLVAMAGSRRYSDVQWMKWYSSIPTSVYVKDHYLSEKYVAPFFEFFFKKKLRVMAFLGFYFAGLVGLLLFFRNRIKDTYKKATFVILCLCGIIHLSSRFIFITDPVYRFGIIAILFLFFAFVILVSEFEKHYKAA